MADAKIEEISRSIDQLLLEKGGPFQGKHIRQHVRETAVHYLRSTIDGVKDASNVHTTSEHLNRAAATLPSKSLFKQCEPCRGKGIVEIGLSLAEVLRQRKKPSFFTSTEPSQAPEGCHWICILCSGTYVIRKRASDLQKHLRDTHGFSPEQVQYVFSPRNNEKLYEYFGPCTNGQAKQNKWVVPRDPAPRAPAKLGAKKDPVEPALPLCWESKRKKKESTTTPTKARVKLPEMNIPASTTLSLTGSTLLGGGASHSKVTDGGLPDFEAATPVQKNDYHEHATHPRAEEEPLAMSFEYIGAQHPEVNPNNCSRQVSEFNDIGTLHTITVNVQNIQHLGDLEQDLARYGGVLHSTLFQPTVAANVDGTVDPRCLELNRPGLPGRRNLRREGQTDGASQCEAKEPSFSLHDPQLPRNHEHIIYTSSATVSCNMKY